MDSFETVGKRFNLPIKRKEIRKRFGKKAFEIIKELFPSLPDKKTRKLVEEKWKVFEKLIKKRGVRKIKYAEEFLRFLNRKKIRIVIASSSRNKSIKLMLRMSGLNKYVKKIVGSDDVRKSKPSPNLIKKALKKIGLKSNECISIGDSVFDIIASNRAKVFSIGVGTGGTSLKKLKEVGANLVCKDLKEVKKWLEKVI